MDTADKILQHHLRNVELGDDAIAQRTDDRDIPGRPSHHLLGLQTDSQRLAQPFVNGDPGGLIDDDPLAAYID